MPKSAKIVSIKDRQITCSEVREASSDYIDDELSREQIIRVSSHLDRCDDCRQFESELREVVLIAQTLVDRPVPPAISFRLRNALADRVGHKSESISSSDRLIIASDSEGGQFD